MPPGHAVIRPSLDIDPRESGLVEAWDLGNPVNGVVYGAKGNNGTVVGGPCVEQTPLGMGMRWAGGSTGVVATAATPIFDGLADCSLEIFVRPNSSALLGYLVDQHSVAWKYAVQYGGVVGNRVLCYMNGWGNYRYSGADSVVPGRWSHIVFVKSGTNLNCFINGASSDGATAGAIPATLPVGNTPITIGNYSLVAQEPDVNMIYYKIYNKALTQDQCRAKYAQAKTAMWKTIHSDISVSTADQGGTVGAYLEQTPMQFGDAVGRWRIEAETVNGVPNCKVIANRTAVGSLYIPTSLMQQNPTEAAFGKWVLYSSVPATSNTTIMLVASYPGAWNNAAQNGYKFDIYPNSGFARISRVTGGVVIVVNWAFNGDFGVGKWEIERTTSGVFSVKYNGLLLGAGLGSNPFTDATHVMSSYMTIQEVTAVGSKILFSSPDSNLCILHSPIA